MHAWHKAPSGYSGCDGNSRKVRRFSEIIVQRSWSCLKLTDAAHTQKKLPLMDVCPLMPGPRRTTYWNITLSANLTKITMATSPLGQSLNK